MSIFPRWKNEFKRKLLVKKRMLMNSEQAKINGKVRADIEVPADKAKAKDKEFVLGLAKEDEKVVKYLSESNLVKETFVPGRIVNLVVKGN